MATPQSPRVSLDEDDQRPFVKPYANKPKFSAGDKVYLMDRGSREGPYYIAAVFVAKYTLCREDGTAVRNGDKIRVDYLEDA
ncbi:hypothetical protein BJY01DRAFT_249787 [Aspergillus pseudoustus]|uniref:Uncharacterized protein n=1 Tax=Aspergillus pseudoustus TaxID=1810923 RepID=A0ABR4JLS2_9EURO